MRATNCGIYYAVIYHPNDRPTWAIHKVMMNNGGRSATE